MNDDEGPDRLAALESAHERYERAQAAVEEIGREHLERIAEALTQLDRLLDQYEDRAIGTGDFGGYVAFRQQVEALVEELPDDLPHRDRFETIAATVDKRRLSERDFETIRETAADLRDEAGRLEEESAAREAYRDARRDAKRRIDGIDDRLEAIDQQLALADVDLEAPVEAIRSPIETYNEAVEAAFHEYLASTPAESVLSLFALTSRYPLVPMDPPPDRLRTYLDELEEPLTVPELLEFAGYSRSKLDHYVADPAALETAVATDRTYLERLSAEPFRIEWPPPPAGDLRWRIQELIPVVDRFADEETLIRLRAVRNTLRDPDQFARLRAVARARSTLDREQRERIQSGALDEERERLDHRRDALERALRERPAP